MRISYSFGIVDLMHYGHIKALSEAKNNSDLHVFGLVSDEAAISWMGTIVSNYDERKKVLENVSCIDEIMYQKTLDPLENLTAIHKKYPDAKITLYYRDDWKITPSIEFLKSIDGKIVYTEYYKKLKPENIVQTLNIRKKEPSIHSNLISTKANTLIALKNLLKKSIIEDILVFSVEEFEKDYISIYEKVNNYFSGHKIVVRSSSSNEDLFEKSNAGHYESVLNVDSTCKISLHSAINTVVESYKKDLHNVENEQILIQKQTPNVKISGVAFTREITENRPYYVINYDDNGSTDSVTSGTSGKTVWISHDSNINELQDEWKNLLISIYELQSIFEGMVLDIEFAINTKNEVIIFQVRPLAANYKYSPKAKDHSFMNLKQNEKIKYLNTMPTEYDTEEMILSDMAFWNPAEIIGSNPKNLDYSLYREIITKSAWNEGLVPMGYNKVNKELMYKIANKPYISVDFSFMSLIPNNLKNDLKLKLVHFYKEKLKKDLTAHDKIEFEIVISCFDFETDSKLEELVYYGFSKNEIAEIRKALFNLTEQAYLNYNKILTEDLNDLEILSTKRKKIENQLSNYNDITDLLAYFKQLLSDIKLHGTPQFSRQARYAFMSNAICKSLVSKGLITQSVMNSFFQSIQTVASEFDRDFKLLLSDKICKEEFNEKYGHLRSGTYDIRTPRYDQTQLNSVHDSHLSHINEDFSIHSSDLNETVLYEHLEKLGFNIDPKKFIKIIKTTIEQREYFKFEFTKSLSLAIEVLALIGEKLGFERPLLSYLDVADVYASQFYCDSTSDLIEFWSSIISQRKALHAERSSLILPEIITSKLDFDFIEVKESRPNFITQQNVTGEIVLLEESINDDITGKIVVISKADPGFDWIFTRNIKGLITKYGGVASHMAIRCAEFGIPAAIGCGEKIYNYVSKLSLINLDCKNGKISGRN